MSEQKAAWAAFMKEENLGQDFQNAEGQNWGYFPLCKLDIFKI